MTELISLNSESATNRIVLLHGWGADAHDLLPVAKLLTEGYEDRFEIVSFCKFSKDCNTNVQENQLIECVVACWRCNSLLNV